MTGTLIGHGSRLLLRSPLLPRHLLLEFDTHTLQVWHMLTSHFPLLSLLFWSNVFIFSKMRFSQFADV